MTVAVPRGEGAAAGALTGLRPEIQALRALAVVLVLLNHLWPERINGGFIGVDVFFVISGYLITAHLSREIDRTGTIRLAAFWARRAKRLLPAAIVVLLFSAVATLIWLPVTSRETALDHIGSAGAYVLNWQLVESSLDYFAQGAAASPVTHYWSLSVEEQFYLFWPLLLSAGILAAAGRTDRVRRLVLVAFVAVVLVGSLVWAVRATGENAASAYFETTARAWEFAAGGLVAFLPVVARERGIAALVLVWSSWAALALAAVSFNSTSGVPGVAALVPVAATAVLLRIGDVDHPWAPTRIVSLAPLQYLGGISYSLYLWHWPWIVAAPFVLDRELTGRDKLVLLGLVLVLSHLTKRFVEDPIRGSTKSFLLRPRWVLSGAAVAVVLVLGITVPASAQLGTLAESVAKGLFEQSSHPGRCFGALAARADEECPRSHVLADPNAVLMNQGNQINDLSNGSTCQQVRGATALLSCSFGVPHGTENLNVALVGDSHAGVWATPLDAVSARLGLRITTYLQSACPATLDPAVVYLDPSHSVGCLAWREAAIAAVAADPSIDVVVTSSNDRSYGPIDDQGRHLADSGIGYSEAWSRWLAAGKKVIAINNVPERGVMIPDCIARSGTPFDPCAVSADLVGVPGPIMKAAGMMHSGDFTFLDVQPVFCDAVTCHAVIGGIPAYMDSDHLSAAFARSFAPEFLTLPALSSASGVR
ncbi:acyltransferase family protein [Cryobacterium sp. MP_M3]|nr:acyltransferase family protein [Cryobacterium sp. MP_M3]